MGRTPFGRTSETKVYIYIYTSSKLVVFLWIVMLNLPGGVVCWVISLVVQISCVQSWYKAGKAAPKFGSVYVPSLKLTACT